MTEERSIDVGYGAIAVAVVAILAYALSLRNGFAFDDVVLIPNDPRVTGTQLGALLTQPYWHDVRLGLYRPLTSVSFALDWYLGRESAAWFHFTNILWHALASVLAFRLLTRFFTISAALFGGVVFALHPVHVEAVANTVGRGELIAATFFLAACVVWASDLSARARVVLVALCYAVAVFAKESAIVLPLVLPLIDYAGGRAWRASPRSSWQLLAALTGVAALFLAARWLVIGGGAPVRVDPSLEVAHTVGARTLTALQAWAVEARLLFFPRTLLADYGPRIMLPIEEFTPLAAFGLTLVIATVLGGAVAIARGHRIWALGLLWFPLTILPVSNFLFPIGVLVAERTLYLPSLAVCIAAAAALRAASRLATHSQRLSRTHVQLGVVLVLVAFTLRTVTRIPDWQSTDSIMLALVRDRPDSFRGQWHLARMARAANDAESSVARYDRALKLWPYREGLVQEAAAYGGLQGRTAWARDVARWGAGRWPGNINFQRMLAANAIDLGDTLTARHAVTSGLLLDPGDSILNAMQRAFGSQGPLR